MGVRSDGSRKSIGSTLVATRREEPRNGYETLDRGQRSVP